MAVVYFKRSYKNPDHYKVGVTGDLNKRYSAKRQRAGIVHTIPVPEDMNMYSFERMVHQELWKYRICGELFRFSAEDLENCKSYKWDKVKK